MPMTIVTRTFQTGIPFMALWLAPVIGYAGTAAAPIPEPGIMALLAAGAVAAALVARSGKK
jgi:hypothetical protein